MLVLILVWGGASAAFPGPLSGCTLSALGDAQGLQTCAGERLDCDSACRLACAFACHSGGFFVGVALKPAAPPGAALFGS